VLKFLVIILIAVSLEVLVFIFEAGKNRYKYFYLPNYSPEIFWIMMTTPLLFTIYSLIITVAPLIK